MKRLFKKEEFETIRCKAEEQETTIVISRKEDTATIYTSDNTMLTKILRVYVKNPSVWECYENPRDREGRVTGYTFKTTRKNISFRSGNKESRKGISGDKNRGDALRAYREKKRQERGQGI